MRFSTFLVFTLSCASSLASPTHQRRIPHEKRQPGSLIKRSRADPTLQMPVRIALAQSNINDGVDRLMDISHPQSANFGKHLTAKEVGDLFRPSGESIGAVRNWLHDSGIESDRHEVSPGKGWLKFSASVEELESLLSTKYHLYEHASTKEGHVGCDEYHIPSHMTSHIDFVSPSVSTHRLGNGKQQKRAVKKSLVPAELHSSMHRRNSPANDSITLPCSIAVTPDCLRGKFS